jgi:hypothetical protein
MKPIEVPDYEDERVYIPFTVPQKGRKALVFKVPRRDFQPPDEVKTLQWLMAEFDTDEDKIRGYVDLDSEVNRVVAVEKACFLLALKPHVSDAQFKQLQKCSYGQLRFVNDRWNEQSRVTLGEYWASANSSMENTEAPSTPTSKSDSDTAGGTSDGDSDGPTSGTG